MITMKTLQAEDLKNDEWLYNALTNGIKECLTAPILTLDPTKPEHIRRTEMILDNFSQEDSPVIATVIAPGNFIQMILPKHDILLSIMFIYKEKNTYVQLIIQKLSYDTNQQKEKSTSDLPDSGSRLKEELSHIVKECFKNEVEKKLDSSTRESIVRSALYNVINKV